MNCYLLNMNVNATFSVVNKRCTHQVRDKINNLIDDSKRNAYHDDLELIYKVRIYNKGN